MCLDNGGQYTGRWLFGKDSNYTVINNGIDIDKFSFKDDKRKEIRSKLGINNNFVLGNIARLSPVKNHDFILQIFNEVLKEKDNAKLVLIGEGILEKQIRNKINEMGIQHQVLLLGKRNDVHELLSALDMFLFPSIFEGYSNAVLEAQTSGLPCLISSSIPKDVVLSRDCLQLPLNLSAKHWAKVLLKFNTNMPRTPFDVQFTTCFCCPSNGVRGNLVKSTVEETLNNLLDAEANRIANATRYERSEERQDTRAGYYNRKLLTKAGEVNLKVPRLRHLPFETAIIELYRRRESSIEEALIEMYLAGVSVRRVEDITEAFWGTIMDPGNKTAKLKN